MKNINKISLLMGLSILQLHASSQELSSVDKMALELIGAMRESVTEYKNVSLEPASPENMQQLEKIKNLFEQSLNQYLINFGQVYEQQAGLFGGYRHLNYIASKDNRQQAITPGQYALLMQTLHDATKNSDLGATINLELSVSRNNKLVDKNLKLNEIIHAIEQVPLPANYSVASIATTAATLAAISVGAYFAWQMLNKNNPLEQTLPAATSLSGVNIPNMSDEKASSSIGAGISAALSNSSDNGSFKTPIAQEDIVPPTNVLSNLQTTDDVTNNVSNLSQEDSSNPPAAGTSSGSKITTDQPVRNSVETDAQNTQTSSWSPESIMGSATIVGATAALAFPRTRKFGMQQLQKASGAAKAASGVTNGLKSFGATSPKVPSFKAPTSNTTPAQAAPFNVPLNHNPVSSATIPSSQSRALAVIKPKHSTAIAIAEKNGAPGAYGNEFSVAGHTPL